MSIKKYTSGSWVDIPYRKYETATDTITTLPADVIADGQSASAVIKGNLSQSGTPTPSSSIYPSETGDKTVNLFDENRTTGISENCYINQNGAVVSSNDYYLSYPIEVDANSDYTWKFNDSSSGGIIKPTHTAPSVGFYDENNNLLSAASHGSYVRYFSFTTPNNCAYIRVSVYKTYKNEAVLNVGPTPIDYQPYGYQIPILSGGTTTPVYLGEVQSTRQIKKLVLTGEEQFLPHQTIASWFQLFLSDIVIDNLELCTHYKPSPYNPANIQNGEILVGKQTAADEGRIAIRDTAYTTAEDFKAFLAAQYAAGTPVTVWYILATPTTTTLNEPIRKIGNYADSVSVTGIPTTGTAEQFDVDTTLKPSEVDLTYHGWHGHSDTKF